MSWPWGLTRPEDIRMSKSSITLPPPRINSQVSLETAMAQCCPVRPYAEE